MSDNKCSFCYTEEKDRVYWPGGVDGTCICGNCCIQFAKAILEKRESEGEGESVNALSEKNEQFQEWLVALEDKWMEKNVINTFIIDAGGSVNEVHFRFEDEDDGYYLVCELEVDGIDELPEDVEENILNEIEWAFDEIRDELEGEGLDLDAYLGEKVILKKIARDDETSDSNPKENNIVMKKLTDDQKNELLTDKEDKLNETGAWVEYIANCGGEIAFVQLDIEQDDDGGWRFIARVITEEKIELSKKAEAAMLDDLEVIADDMYYRFEEFGLDPQDRVGMKVLVIADNEQ